MWWPASFILKKSQAVGLQVIKNFWGLDVSPLVVQGSAGLAGGSADDRLQWDKGDE